MQLWDDTLSVRWAPDLLFFEERVALLRAIGDEGALSAFFVGENGIGSRLGDDDHELRITLDGLTLFLTKPDPDRQRATRALDLTFEKLRPAPIGQLRIVQQFIGPIRGEFEVAAKRFTDHLAPPDLPQMTATDSALILDGRVELEDGWSIHTELGIVAAGEIAQRLSTPLAGIPVPISRDAMERWSSRELPPVAFYVGLGWTSEIDDFGELSSDQVVQKWDAVTEASGRLVEHLAGKLPTDPDSLKAPGGRVRKQ
jgi:hypothetical protein